MRPQKSESEGSLLSNRTHAGRWQAEFPFGWDADDLVSRRQLLRLAVFASGALFAATAGLAGLSFARERTRGGTQKIIDANLVPAGGVHYFNYPGENDHAILLHLPDQRFVAYSGKCTHLSCAVYWNQDMGKLRCPCHEGIFDAATGEVLAGPPTRPLPKIELQRSGDILYAVEEVAE